jgi:hypothetical protein
MRDAYNTLDVEGRDHWENRSELYISIHNVILKDVECDIGLFFWRL